MNDVHSLVGAYVADALDGDEREHFDAHLTQCGPCRDEVASLRETMAELAALHEVPPPPPLRAAVLEAISTTAQLPADHQSADHQSVNEQPAPSNVVSPTHGFARHRRPITTWLAAAAAVVAMVLGGVTVWQQSQLVSLQSAAAQRADLLAAPDLQALPAALGASEVTYLVSQQRGEALLASSNLPDPGAGRSWQVWVMEDGAPRSGAVVDGGGQVQAWISDVAGGEALAITNEPRGGSPGPTGDVQAGVEL